MGAAQFNQAKFEWTTYLLGYVCLFFLELSTVFTNDVFDYESDRRNEWYGPFSGGSRSLVDERLTRSQLITGSWVAAFLSCVAGIVACGADGTSPGQSLIVLLVLAFLAIGYTVPPLKFSHRGLGELDVGLTHSVGVILCGYVLQTGGWRDAFPWILSFPLFLAILPSILLAGIPDRPSDEAAGKRTLCVRLGSRKTVVLAAVLSIAAVLSAIGSNGLPEANHAYRHIGWFVVPHSLWLISRLRRLYRRIDQPQRIDGTIAGALLFILWFVIVPVVNLAFGSVP
jgi:1,4-dihydroxy-2-naphthoate octaprenyltransferase